jgi:hypothetical protein
MIPAGIALTLLFVASVLFLPRRLAALGVMASVCYITQGQFFTVVGFHMHAVRIVLLAAMIRLMVRGEFRYLKVNKIDWAVLAYAVVVNLVPILRERTSEELVYRLGSLYDILLSYWVFRGLFRNWEELETYLAGLAFLIVPMALEMIFENLTHRSLFEPFGGIGDLTIREGRPRCQGAFRIGITAGVFGAALIPMFISLYRFKGRGLSATVGLIAAIVITYTSNSSGPLMAALSSFVAWMFWSMRTKMKKVRWGIILLLLLLQLSMKVPIWFIFSKLGALTGGDGWHRSYLIDRFIHFFSDWWLMGTKNTSDWMPTVLSDGNADITDLYVAAGINGGLLALVLLILILVRCFRYLGLALGEFRAQSSSAEFLFWGLGGALFSHVVTLFSVTYWDQLFVALWSCLAIISSVTANALEHEPAAHSLQQEQELSPNQVLS